DPPAEEVAYRPAFPSCLHPEWMEFGEVEKGYRAAGPGLQPAVRGCRPTSQQSPRGRACVRFSLFSPAAAFLPANPDLVANPRVLYSLRDIMTPIVFKWTEFAVADGLRLGAILIIALILNRILRVLTRRLIPAAGTEGLGRIARLHEQHVKTLAGLIYSAGTAIIAVGAILTTLPLLGFNVTPIAAVAGLASLAFGFGAQHLVRDVINGFFIFIEDQFVVGETVRIGTVVGRVEHLTLRRTVIRDIQGALVSIPNGEISQVANLSRDWGQVFVDVAISSDGSSDAALASLERVSSEL